MDHLAVVGVATLGSTGAGGGVTLGLLADEGRSGSSGRFAACTNQGLDAWDWRPMRAFHWPAARRIPFRTELQKQQLRRRRGGAQVVWARP